MQYILAIELLAASQAVEFRRPLKSSAALENVIQIVRKQIPIWQEEHYFAIDIETAYSLIPHVL